MRAIKRLLDRINLTLTTLGGLAITLMMVHITLDVLMRFIFNKPLPGTITIVSQYYMLIAVFLPLAYAEQTKSHISVELFTDRMPIRIQQHLAGWIYLASSIMCFIVTARTWGEALGRMAASTSVMQGDFNIIVWPTYFLLPIGFFLFGITLTYKFLHYIINNFKDNTMEAFDD